MRRLPSYGTLRLLPALPFPAASNVRRGTGLGDVSVCARVCAHAAGSDLAWCLTG